MAARTAALHRIAPFFIVDDLQASLDFYHSRLGFEITYTGGGNGAEPDFFGIVERGGVMLMLKQIAPGIHPIPNHSRHEYARWDAYVDTSDPDLLYAEYVGRSVPVHSELADTSDGLRAFEIKDNSGYVLCFGRPLTK
jgi:catechol 2,3-dioxygenase-like lactoylglutathione lyase family enzyme